MHHLSPSQYFIAQPLPLKKPIEFKRLDEYELAIIIT